MGKKIKIINNHTNVVYEVPLEHWIKHKGSWKEYFKELEVPKLDDFKENMSPKKEKQKKSDVSKDVEVSEKEKN